MRHNIYIQKSPALVRIRKRQPLAGFRHAKALEHRTKIDWAKQMKWLADEVYPNAEKIIMVCDNLEHS